MMSEAITVAELPAKRTGNSPTAVDTGLRLIGKLMDCGDVEGAAWWMGRVGPGLGRDADERQSLELVATRARLADIAEREAASGGSGSLFDPNHPFAVGMREAEERARHLGHR